MTALIGLIVYTYLPSKHSDSKEIGNNGRSVGTTFFSLVGPKKAFWR